MFRSSTHVPWLEADEMSRSAVSYLSHTHTEQHSVVHGQR